MRSQPAHQLQYLVPEALPHINTMSDTHSMYGRVEEFLRVRVDDGGASVGAPAPRTPLFESAFVLDAAAAGRLGVAAASVGRLPSPARAGPSVSRAPSCS